MKREIIFILTMLLIGIFSLMGYSSAEENKVEPLPSKLRKGVGI